MESRGIANADIAEVRKQCDVDRGQLDGEEGEKKGERERGWRKGLREDEGWICHCHIKHLKRSKCSAVNKYAVECKCVRTYVRTERISLCGESRIILSSEMSREGDLNIRRRNLLYSAVQCSTVQYSTVQYSTVQYSIVQYSIVQYSTVQYSIVQYSTVQYSIV